MPEIIPGAGLLLKTFPCLPREILLLLPDWKARAYSRLRSHPIGEPEKNSR